MIGGSACSGNHRRFDRLPAFPRIAAIILKELPRFWLFFPLLALYLPGLGSAGFLAPDEPRYASIGRQMARTHDFITPVLDGTPWFEKPPLLYWMIALGRMTRLPDEWAARLPVALLSIAFIVFFFHLIAREFSPRMAIAASTILATSAGWLAYSYIAVTDLPMAVFFTAAMLLALFGEVLPGRRTHGFIAGVLLGLAILAKAFVPVVLFVPAFLIARGKRLAILAGCVAAAAPWHLLCWAKNGNAFWRDYFWKQQVLRFFSPELQHVQPFWFYVPILLGGLFPWTPLAGLLARKKLWDDVGLRFFAVWLLFAFAFFSIAKNKLPGYALPLLPPLAILLAAGIEKAGAAAKWWLASTMLLLLLLPMISAALPGALLSGFRRARFAAFPALPFLIAAAAVWWLFWMEKPNLSMIAAGIAVLFGVMYLKGTTLPALDRQVSIRAFWREHRAEIDNACVEPDVRREWVYGLNYYAGRPLPICGESAARDAISAELAIQPGDQR
jgi:4-amino-4-deoxy-L-arabinose transferase-like glycosyltransferase